MNLSKNRNVDISAEVGSVHDGSFGNAIKLIEYLTSEEAQEVYVNNRYEYPANPSVEPSEIVKNWGEFKIDKLNLNALNGKNFEVEELKLKNLRNNMIIVFLGIVIGAFIVF